MLLYYLFPLPSEEDLLNLAGNLNEAGWVVSVENFSVALSKWSSCYWVLVNCWLVEMSSSNPESSDFKYVKWGKKIWIFIWKLTILSDSKSFLQNTVLTEQNLSVIWIWAQKHLQSLVYQLETTTDILSLPAHSFSINNLTDITLSCTT